MDLYALYVQQNVHLSKKDLNNISSERDYYIVRSTKKMSFVV